MTANFVPIYSASVLTIGVLATFAWHNRKTGWKKQRRDFAQAMSDLYVDLGLSAGDAAPRHRAIPAWTPVNEEESIGFSAQLLHLRTALGSTHTAPAAERTQQVRELVLK